jgi:hypothetical protein
MTNLNGAEQRLLAHMRAMGGWVTAPLVPAEHEVMGDLVAKKLAEYDAGNIRRYVLTPAGAAAAEQIANSR